MNDNHELYRRYKNSRQKESSSDEPKERSDQESEHSTAGEVDKLYQVFRETRDPDFDNSIADVMQVAREKIETEKAIKKIMESPEVRAAVASKPAASKPGIFTTLLQAPSRFIESVGALFSADGTPNWTRVAIPAMAFVAIAAGVMMNMFSNELTNGRDANDLDLAFVNSDSENQPGNSDSAQLAIALSQYINTDDNSSLAFGGGSNSDQRSFLLGASSIDLQIAALAEKSTLMDQSIDHMSGLLSSEQNSSIVEKLETLRNESQSDYPETTKVIEVVAKSRASSENWFEFGRDVQLVHFSSQLALEDGTSAPLRASVETFATRYKQMDRNSFTKPELNAIDKILSLSEKVNFTIDELKILRDSSRDIKAIRG